MTPSIEPGGWAAQCLATGAYDASFEGHCSSVRALAVLPDGRFASGSDDATIKIWDPARGNSESSQLIFVVDEAITTLVFIADGSILVAGDSGGRLHWLRFSKL